MEGKQYKKNLSASVGSLKIVVVLLQIPFEEILLNSMPPKHFNGWRAGLARCTAVAGIVTAINITFLLVAIPRLDISSSGSSEGALFSGDCKRAKKFSIWLHLAINLLATALLAAGNYTQQVLTAPMRNEINIAHSQRKWLDIGISSLHNLRHISGKRVTAWILLALTSVPIHLL
jgi:hypothetical protein